MTAAASAQHWKHVLSGKDGQKQHSELGAYPNPLLGPWQSGIQAWLCAHSLTELREAELPYAQLSCTFLSFLCVRGVTLIVMDVLSVLTPRGK